MVTTAIRKRLDTELWTLTPIFVRDFMKVARAAQQEIAGLPCREAYVHPHTGEIRLVAHDGRTLEKVGNICVGDPPKPGSDWILIKCANPFRAAGAFWRGSQTLLGGPSPLAAMIVGMLLGGGGGYGTGALLEYLFPEKYVTRGRLRRVLGVAGALGGTVPGLLKWQANAASLAEADKPGAWRALVAPDASIPVLDRFTQFHDLANPQSRDSRAGEPPLVSRIERTMTGLPEAPKTIKHAATAFAKLAFTDFGAADAPPVPVDAFNNAIWNDVRKGVTASKNPFGTKSPWGDNRQPLHTPPAVGAAASGVVTGIQQMYGDSPILHPKHFIHGLASAGLNLATARIAGGILGALGGLTPEAQNKLQDMGLWGGFIGGAMKSIFR